jgi:acyl carrier protein
MDAINLLTEFLRTEVAYESKNFTIDPEEDILMRGLVDSMSIMTLMAYIEKTFNVKVDAEDMIPEPENFQSLNRIKDLITRKRNPKD